MKNKRIRVLALSALSLLALTACDEIVTKPTDYSDPLINTPSTFTDEVYHNIASVVYDSIHDNGIGNDVLNEVLYLYGVTAFGPYDAKVKVNGAPVGDGEITLKQAASDTASTDTINTFVQNHKAYWDSTRTDATGAASESEIKRVKAKWNTIEDRIAETMYDKISGGTYTDRHIFSEEKFLKSLSASLESVSDPSTVTQYHKEQLLPEVEPEDVFDPDRGYLYRAYYDSDNNSYIVDEIVPDIYRQLLTEQYVLDETYNTLGRSYARQVNIIKFKNNDNYPNSAYYLAKQLVGEINESPTEYASGEIVHYGLLERFKQYSNAEVGVIGELGTEAAILTAAGITEGKVDTGDTDLDDQLKEELGTFYLGTEYGDIAEKYISMKDVRHNGVNSDYESTFTNSGVYPTYVGLNQEKLTLKENDYTYTGWFVKNGGLTDLPESVRSRLFNIGVATGVKETATDIAKVARTYADGKWSEGEDENAYVCYINGHFYLKTASRVKGDKIDNDILHYDADSKTYYIVEIEQAVASSKLSKTSERNYANTLGEDKMQEIINEVCKIVGKGESYSTLATKKYLKAMDIAYHDQSVYDYFKTNYPELFGEEASE